MRTRDRRCKEDGEHETTTIGVAARAAHDLAGIHEGFVIIVRRLAKIALMLPTCGPQKLSKSSPVDSASGNSRDL